MASPSSSGDGSGRPPNFNMNHIVWSRRSEAKGSALRAPGAGDVTFKYNNDLSSSHSQDASSSFFRDDSLGDSGSLALRPDSELGEGSYSGRKGHQLWESEKDVAGAAQAAHDGGGQDGAQQVSTRILHSRMAAAERVHAARAGPSTAQEEEELEEEDEQASVDSGGEEKSIEASLGSTGHYDGTCKPCYFVSRSGCTKGKDCRYCHLPHSKSSRRPKPCKRSRERYRSIYREIEADPNGLPELLDVESRLPTSVQKNEVLKNRLMDRLTGYREYLRSKCPEESEEALPVFGAQPALNGHRRHIVAL